LEVSQYRREKQLAYNKEHNITPRSVSRAVEDSLAVYQNTRKRADMLLREGGGDFDITQTISQLQAEMVEAADNLQFEKAALLRDQIRELKQQIGEPALKPQRKVTYRKQKRSQVTP
jgi:excinuclease ABC subunit B